jgi:lysozyme family protein
MATQPAPGEPLEIVICAYSHRYGNAVRKLLDTEGGFSNDPVDRGGTTNFGITLRFLQGEAKLDPELVKLFDLDMDGDLDGADIRGLTKGEAVYLYHHCFWERYHLESFAEPIGEILLDQEVNDGATGANKLLQRAINSCSAHMAGVDRLNVDGVLGDATHAAMDAVLEHPGLGMPALVEAFREAARARYRAIVAANPSQQKFLDGWLARADELGRES